MSNNKGATLWFVNVLSFILFSILTITGLINWLIIPGGHRGDSGLRHFLRDIHGWTAVLFVIVVVIHLILHWPYIRSNLKTRSLK
jgi:hypothetical protein